MDHTFDFILLAAAVLLLAAVLASRASGRMGIPALLMFVAVGMVAGEDGPGGIPFNDSRLAQWVGIVSLVLILFSGGLETRWSAIAGVARRGLSLATVGVFITAGLTGIFAAWVLQLGWKQGLLLGAIVSSTDAAAVFSVLRSTGLSLKGQLQELLEFESGSNDPMAVFLTSAMIQWNLSTDLHPGALAAGFLWQMAVGALLGYGLGKTTVWLLNRIALDAEGLYPVLTLSMAVLSYSGTAAIGGNGFLAVYLAGVTLGSENFLHKSSLKRFHDGLSWLLQIVMFLVLGLLVFPRDLPPIAPSALAITFFLMLLARPVAVYSSLAFADMPFRYKTLVAWTGLRGAVPIVLATFPLLAGVPNAKLYFDVVFFIVLASVLFQGTTLPLAARLLRAGGPNPKQEVPILERWPVKRGSAEMVELQVHPGSSVEGKALVSAGLPPGVLVMLIRRGEDFVVPRGATVLRAGDEVLVLASESDLAGVKRLLET